MVKAITIERVEGKPGKVYCPLLLTEVEGPKRQTGEVLVRMRSAALNHRDVFIRQYLYPGASDGVPLLADGCGVVEQADKDDMVDKRVILNPGHGWVSDPYAPEDNQMYRALGGTIQNPLGTLQEVVSVSEDDVAIVPDHLTDNEAAALPLAGLTGWRALNSVTENVPSGGNIFIPGIGGGVAIFVLQFAVAMGFNVYVSSSSEDKLSRARNLGAKGGVNYKNESWEKELQKMLPTSRPYLDAVIDGSGNDIVKRTVKVLKQGGIIAIYGMTASPQTVYPMQAVMKSISIKGIMMGSRREFKDLVEFVDKHKIKPIVDSSVKGIDNVKDIDGLFENMKNGKQFGKLVVEFDNSNPSKL